MLSGYARIDLRLDASGQAYVIEANPNPQLSPDEDFARSAQTAGTDFGALLDKIVTLGPVLGTDALGLGGRRERTLRRS